MISYFSRDSPHFYDSDMDSKFLVRINHGYSEFEVFVRIFTIISCVKMECEISEGADYLRKNMVTDKWTCTSLNRTAIFFTTRNIMENAFVIKMDTVNPPLSWLMRSRPHCDK